MPIYVMKKCIFIIMLFLCISALVAEKRAMTVEDMWQMKRVGNIALSPNGEYIAYTITTYDMDTNKSNTDIWMISYDGSTLKQLTSKPGYEGNPKWSPNGKELGFMQATEKGKMQVFAMNVDTLEVVQKTDLPVDVDDYSWAPNSEDFLVAATVYANMSLEESNKKDEERINSKVQAQVIDELLYRHWNSWTYGKYSHVFYVNGKDAVDLTPGKYNTPPIALGGTQDFCLSPDGQTLYFVRNVDKMVARSTNNDIFSVSIYGGVPQLLTPNRGGDVNPVVSPNGKYLAYTSMAREGFEADEQDLIVLNLKTGERVNLTTKFNRDVTDPIWGSDDYIYFYAYDNHLSCIYRVNIHSGDIEKLIDENYNKTVKVRPDGKLVFLRQAVDFPFEIFTADANGANVKQITFSNKDILDKLAFNKLENFWFTSFDGCQVQALLVRPPFFDANKKYPVVLLIHGGPQGSWNDDFHFRWNLSLFAAPGYVVVAVNPRGSKGYGQKFCDAVSGDWGGGPYKDIMECVKVIETFPFIDKNRIGAAGGSYGGYMTNWINGQTDRFKCLITHAGLFDITSKFGSTEELWFPEWEFHGTPYTNPELYKKFSPSTYAKNFKTPTLVIHGQYDFRVDVSQAFQTFTALQRLGVPSRFIYYPDECHFVTKPQNARLWWNEVHGWFDKWLRH